MQEFPSCQNYPSLWEGGIFYFYSAPKKNKATFGNLPCPGSAQSSTSSTTGCAGGVQVGRSQADELRVTLFASPSLATPLQASVSSTHSMAMQPLQHLLHVAFSSPGTQGHQHLGFWSCFSERPPCSPPGAGAGGDIPPLAAGGFAGAGADDNGQLSSWGPSRLSFLPFIVSSSCSSSWPAPAG